MSSTAILPGPPILPTAGTPVHRQVLRRTILPGFESTAPGHNFDLRWAAWGAAIETLQIEIVAQGWMGLFAGLLKPSPCTELRWEGAGPGANAEIKRAYSALFGRFFGRGALRSDHNIRYLIQVEDGLEIAPGYVVRRKAGPDYEGDLPDWVGWCSKTKRVVFAEAKGSHEKGNWGTGKPSIVRKAMEQVERVELRDSTSVIATKSWVVASRWGTVENGKDPVLITYDPLSEGRALRKEEEPFLEGEMRARWVAGLLDALGQDKLGDAVRRGREAADLDGTTAALNFMAGGTVRRGIGAVAIDGFGLAPLVWADSDERVRSLLEFARSQRRAAAVVTLDLKVVASAAARQPGVDQQSEQTVPDGFFEIDGLAFAAYPTDGGKTQG